MESSAMSHQVRALVDEHNFIPNNVLCAAIIDAVNRDFPPDQRQLSPALPQLTISYPVHNRENVVERSLSGVLKHHGLTLAA